MYLYNTTDTAYMAIPNKEKAINLRRDGLSYTEISKILTVSKSTMSYWFKNLPFSSVAKLKNITSAKIKWAENILIYNNDILEISVIPNNSIFKTNYSNQQK